MGGSCPSVQKSVGVACVRYLAHYGNMGLAYIVIAKTAGPRLDCQVCYSQKAFLQGTDCCLLSPCYHGRVTQTQGKAEQETQQGRVEQGGGQGRLYDTVAWQN